jgi:hypothetical protein
MLPLALWRIGGKRFFFCGAAGADLARGIPYCPRHMQRAYIVPPTLVVRPLHRVLARNVEDKRDIDSSSRSFPRKRESIGAAELRGDTTGSPLSRGRAGHIRSNVG